MKSMRINDDGLSMPCVMPYTMLVSRHADYSKAFRSNEPFFLKFGDIGI